MKKSKYKFLYRWYSICSHHYQYDENCDICNIGSWMFIPGLFLSKILYKISPKFWQSIHNTKKRKKAFLNSFKNKKNKRKG